MCPTWKFSLLRGNRNGRFPSRAPRSGRDLRLTRPKRHRGPLSCIISFRAASGTKRCWKRNSRSRRTSGSGGANAILVVDDTALAKKGSHSVGVAPQYASALGKTANCQTLVSLTLARDEVSGDDRPAPVSAGELDRRPRPDGEGPPARELAGGGGGAGGGAARTKPESRWPRSTASAPLAFGLRRCWRMQAMACPRRSAKGSTRDA